MAFTSVEFEATAADVFAVLIDPTTYPRWLVGAEAIRAVDADWPAPGSRFHHRVGFGPLALQDSTKVLEVETDRVLRLAVRARPLISAVVTFRLVGDAARRCCVLTWEEEPAQRRLGALVRPLFDPMTHLRNHRSGRRLVAVVHQRQRGGRGSDDARPFG